MYIYIIYTYIHIYTHASIYVGAGLAAAAAGRAGDGGLDLSRGFIVIMPSPPIKSLGFRGFDSSKLLILRGWNVHVR